MTAQKRSCSLVVYWYLQAHSFSTRFLCRPRPNVRPSLVVEIGWSESRPVLHPDRVVCLWLIGGTAATDPEVHESGAEQGKGGPEDVGFDRATNTLRLLQREANTPNHSELASTRSHSVRDYFSRRPCLQSLLRRRLTELEASCSVLR